MATTFTDSKSDLMRRAQEQLSGQQTAESQLTTRQKLALTCRALFDAGHDSGLAGQVTARAATARSTSSTMPVRMSPAAPGIPANTTAASAN